jgi:hypothetical protein
MLGSGGDVQHRRMAIWKFATLWGQLLGEV